MNDIDGLMLDLQSVAELPDEVAEEMLEAEAEIVKAAQVYTGMEMDVYLTGATLRSIGRGRMKHESGGSRAMYVYPRGKNEQGVRNAEVAFINEFGAPDRKIEARPFIKTANEESAEAAVEAAAKVYDRFLKSRGL